MGQEYFFVGRQSQPKGNYTEICWDPTKWTGFFIHFFLPHSEREHKKIPAQQGHRAIAGCVITACHLLFASCLCEVQGALNSNVACGDRNALNSSVCKSTYWYTVLFTKGIAECFPDCVRNARRESISVCVAGGTEALAITIKEGISKYRYKAAHSRKKKKKEKRHLPNGKLSSSQTKRSISLQEQQGLTVAYKLPSGQDGVKWCAVKVSSLQSPRACLLITFAITNMTNILIYSAFHLEQACFASQTVTASSHTHKPWKKQSALCSRGKDHFMGIYLALKSQGKAWERSSIERMDGDSE